MKLGAAQAPAINLPQRTSQAASWAWGNETAKLKWAENGVSCLHPHCRDFCAKERYLLSDNKEMSPWPLYELDATLWSGHLR